jgi:glycolate oxidase iron-sulfur subunit
VNATGAPVIAASNPGCMLQLRAGVKKFGKGQRVAHVVEILDEAYQLAQPKTRSDEDSNQLADARGSV